MADLRREMPCQGCTVGIFEREQPVSLPLRQMSATGALAGFSNRSAFRRSFSRLAAQAADPDLLPPIDLTIAVYRARLAMVECRETDASVL